MKNRLPYFRTFPDDFMMETRNELSKAIRKGVNLQLVGLKGSGKSLALRMIGSCPKEFEKYEIFNFDMSLLTDRSRGALLSMMSNGIKAVESGKRAIFLFDSFEEVVNMADEEVVKVFKAIYDRYRDYLTMVFSVERPIKIHNSLFGKAYFIKPLSDDDLNWFWNGVEEAHNVKIESDIKMKIIKSSGGYMSIIKRLMEAVFEGEDIGRIISNPSLNPHLLYQLELMKEGLRGENNYFETPIYETFLKNKEKNNKYVEILGELKIKTKLTVLENKVLINLDKNRNKLVLRDQSIVAVWGENAAGGVAEHALDQIIYRLNKKLIESGCGLKIETVRGRGHVLKV